MTAPINDSETHKRKNRPLLVWIISIFYVLSVSWTAFSFWALLSGIVPTTPATQAYLDALTAFDYAATLLISFTNLAAAVCLFMLWRYALHLFVFGFFVSVSLAVYHTLSKGWAAALGGSGLFGALIGYVVIIVVIAYTYRLLRKGALR